ncbi:MAG: Ppx/GppA family phosphatase, partial [Robiginitomaculum sp.]|nr:Ppx/GppA family phosphatase [Robiginitomaculum sp.]
MPDGIISGSKSDANLAPPQRRESRANTNSYGRGKQQHFAAIDLGTNNCRLLIARSQSNGFKIIDSYSNVVRLGAGLSQTGRLSEESMAATLKALEVCAAKMKAKSVKRWRCIATQACREAENGSTFLSQVKSETGLLFETISPRVEARLAVMGCMNLLDDTKDVALVIDIGGGSTELSWVDIRRFNSETNPRLHRPPISAWVSLPIGVVNLSEMYPERPHDLEGWYEDMKNHVREQMISRNCEKRFANVFKDGRGHLIGTSGTITSLASVHLKLPFYQRNKIDGIWINSQDALDTARRLVSLPLEKRQQEP